VSGNRLFVLERGDVSNIIEITEGMAVLEQRHLVDDSNPVDVVEVSSGRLMISLNNLNQVIFIDM